MDRLALDARAQLLSERRGAHNLIDTSACARLLSQALADQLRKHGIGGSDDAP
jgi:hypothetical protein